MGKLNAKKLAGSTLIEVLIAMVIIMVVFSIAMGLFSNVLRGGVSYRKIQAMNQMELLKNEVLQNKRFERDHVMIDSVDYEFTSKSSAVSGIAILEIKARDRGKLLGNIRCFYPIENNEGF